MRLAIIGANEYQNRLIIEAQKKNIETYVFSWSENEIGAKNAKNFILSDVNDKEFILEQCEKLNIDGVCSVSSDLTNITVDFIRTRLNQRKNPADTIIKTTNKFEMRKSLELFGCPIPFYELTTKFDKQKIYNYPLIVKPIDRSGSRGITKVNNQNELFKAIKSSQSVSFVNEVLIEEFINGHEFSIESFSIDGIHHIFQVTEKFTTGEPNFIEKAHLAPARIDNNLFILIKETIKIALNALNIKNGSSHSEIKIDYNNNIKIIEIGSRMGGDFIGSDLVKYSCGINILDLEIKNALNIKINDSCFISKEKKHNIMSFFFFKKNDIANFEKIKHKIELIDYSYNNKIKKITNSADRLGYAIFKIDNENLDKIITTLEI